MRGTPNGLPYWRGPTIGAAPQFSEPGGALRLTEGEGAKAEAVARSAKRAANTFMVRWESCRSIEPKGVKIRCVEKIRNS